MMKETKKTGALISTSDTSEAPESMNIPVADLLSPESGSESEIESVVAGNNFSLDKAIPPERQWHKSEIPKNRANPSSKQANNFRQRHELLATLQIVKPSWTVPPQQNNGKTQIQLSDIRNPRETHMAIVTCPNVI